MPDPQSSPWLASQIEVRSFICPFPRPPDPAPFIQIWFLLAPKGNGGFNFGWTVAPWSSPKAWSASRVWTEKARQYLLLSCHASICVWVVMETRIPTVIENKNSLSFLLVQLFGLHQHVWKRPPFKGQRSPIVSRVCFNGADLIVLPCGSVATTASGFSAFTISAFRLSVITHKQ